MDPRDEGVFMRKLMSIWGVLPRGQQLFLVLLATFIVIPFVVLLFLQVYNAYQLTRLGNDISVKQDEWKYRAASLNANVVPESLKSPANQFAYQLLEAHGDMVAERRLVVTIQQPLGERKLKSGKILTEEELLGAATDRIQDVADTCAAIRKKAGNCSVTSLSVASKLDRGTPMVRLAASAAYANLVPASDITAATR